MELYKITRKKASKLLNISTRSVDRYIKAWKLRAKKDWKIILIHEDDINKLLSWNKKTQEVIIPKKEEKKTKKEWKQEKIESSKVSVIDDNNNSVEYIYNNLRNEIDKKDSVIQELSMRLWRAEEVAKNSISLIEFKKSQFLLEESRGYLNKEVDELNRYRRNLKLKLKHEKKTNYILLAFTIILFITMVIVWFTKI